MSHLISKEELKSALLELVQSDKKFVSSLLAELVLHLPTSTVAVQSPRKRHAGAKEIPTKVVPAYRQNIKKTYPKAGLKKATVEELRELFSDAPPAEQIIKAIHK